MPQLILSPRNTEDIERLNEQAMLRGWTVIKLPSWRLPSDLDVERDLAVYGEPLFARMIAAQCDRVLLEPPPAWLTQLEPGVTRRTVRRIRFDEIRNLSYPRFLKPPDDKIFPAKVYDSPQALLQRNDIPANQEILQSDVVTFHKEFRVHVHNHEAVTASRYCIDGELSESSSDSQCAEALSFATHVAQSHRKITPGAVAMDVGIIDSGSWAVVEANPVFGAGIYHCDPDVVLDVLLDVCVPIDDHDPSLQAFLFPVTIQ